MKKTLILLSILALLIPCQAQKEADAPLITKNLLTLSSDLMTPEVLWSFGRLGDVQVSPDGKKILYGVSYYSIEQNRSNRELFCNEQRWIGKTAAYQNTTK